MVKGVLFDMDGVLLDTERYGREALIAVAKERGYAFPPELYNRLLGANYHTGKQITLDYFGGEYPYDEIHDAFFERHIQAARKGVLPKKEGLAECLRGLKDRELRLAIATSTDRDVVELFKENIWELREFFDAEVCGIEVPNGKPAPDIFLRAAQKLGLAPEDCIGVEDSRNGLRSLTAAGIRSVMIPDLLPYDDSFADIVSYHLESLSGLCGLIDRLNGKA